MDQAVGEIWDEEEDPDPEDVTDGALHASEADRQRILEGLVHDIADMTEEILELGSYQDFDRLFDVLFVAQEQASAWEELLVPLEELWEEDGDDVDVEVDGDDA